MIAVKPIWYLLNLWLIDVQTLQEYDGCTCIKAKKSYGGIRHTNQNFTTGRCTKLALPDKWCNYVGNYLCHFLLLFRAMSNECSQELDQGRTYSSQSTSAIREKVHRCARTNISWTNGVINNLVITVIAVMKFPGRALSPTTRQVLHLPGVALECAFSPR